MIREIIKVAKLEAVLLDPAAKNIMMKINK